MPEVGVRELKTRASEILKDVRDNRAHYILTYRGRPVGVLSPIAEIQPNDSTGQDAWERLVKLGKEIDKGWESPLTSYELLSEMRR